MFRFRDLAPTTVSVALALSLAACGGDDPTDASDVGNAGSAGAAGSAGGNGGNGGSGGGSAGNGGSGDGGSGNAGSGGAMSNLSGTDPILLSTGSPSKDEDPSVLHAQDGSLYVAYYSDREQNGDVYIQRTVDGETWSDPVRATANADADYYPHLIQAGAGEFHMVWYRRMSAYPYYAHVWTNTSADGLTWDPERARLVSAAPEGVDPTIWDVEDHQPTMVEAKDGRLLVYFVSRLRAPVLHNLFVSESDDTGETWSFPEVMPELASNAENAKLPYASRVGDDVALTWVRHANSSAVSWEDPTSDVFYATSADGLSFASAVSVTDDDAAGALDLFPSFYSNLSDEWSLMWVSTATAEAKSLSLALSKLDGYPNGTVDLPLESQQPRVSSTDTPGVYLGVWVEGERGQEDIYYRFFEKP